MPVRGQIAPPSCDTLRLPLCRPQLLPPRSFDRQVEVPPPDAAARAAFFAATVQRPEIASHLRCAGEQLKSGW